MMPRAQIAVAVLALTSLLAAQTHVHTDRAGAKHLPLPKSSDVWHFAIYGDRTGGPAEGIKILAQAVEDTNLLDPDLVMTVGDLVQGYNTTKEWMPQMREFQRTMGGLRMPWFPVAGNHDVYWRGKGRPEGAHETNYEKHFGPLWYWFEHKDAAMIVLYSDEGDPQDGSKGFREKRHTQMSAAQLAWLEKTLEETRRYEHVFVFLHHPRWVTQSYPGTNWDAVHQRLKKPGNVRAVFAGHIHHMRYDGKRDGIEYFALATTGGHLWADIPRAGYLHHYNIVTVRKSEISVATVPVGSVIDPRSIDPERIADVRALATMGLPSTSPLTIEKDASASGHPRITLTNPAKHPIEVELSLELPSGWSAKPDHRHGKIAPGQSRLFEFTVKREAGDWKSFELPRLVAQVDLLIPKARIALPKKSSPLDARPSRALAAASAEDHALDLRGRGCLRIPSEALKTPQGAITLEGWVNARSYEGRRPFVTKTEGSEFGIFMSNGRPAFSVHLDGRYVNARAEEAVLQADRWHHLAGVFDGEEVRLYVDGKLVARQKGKGKRKTNRHPLFVGADPNNKGKAVDRLNGKIDEVRLSKVARYRGESFEAPRRFRSDESTLLLLHLDRKIGPFLIDSGPRNLPVLGRGKLKLSPRKTAIQD